MSEQNTDFEAFNRKFQEFKDEQAQAPRQASEQRESKLDVGKYLSHYGIEYKIKNNGEWAGYCLSHCVFDPAHRGNEASIRQHVSGKLTYQCFHNSCKGKTWAEARQIISGEDKLTQFMPGAAALGYGSGSSARNPGGARKAKFMNVGAMVKEFGKKIEWLWRDHIPKQNPVVYAGREGSGKSSNVAQVCKEIVEADPEAWVLWVATEGFVSDHTDKWVKLGLPDRVVMLSDDKGVYKLQLDNYKDRDFLDQALSDLKSQTGGRVVAVVIDSIRGMQSMGENDPKLSGVMSQINSLVCDKHKASCIYIAHHKKGIDANRLNKVAGSTGITSSVRAVYAVERVSEFVCKIIPDKSNALGHNPKTYRSVLIENDDEGYDIYIVEDVGQDDGTMKTKAERFLIDLFKEQEQYLTREIYERGAEVGLSRDTLRKAKDNLPVEAIHENPKAPWIWRCSLYGMCQ